MLSLSYPLPNQDYSVQYENEVLNGKYIRKCS